MKAFVCEMCGSHDIVKKNGLYVCRNCNMQYDPEEAKKLMTEGTVATDDAEETEILYRLARRALEKKEFAESKRYYEELQKRRPDDWEAYLYALYCGTLGSNSHQGKAYSIKVSKSEGVLLQLIRNGVPGEQKLKEAIGEACLRICEISEYLYANAQFNYTRLGRSAKTYDRQKMVIECCAARDICYHFGDILVENMGDAFGEYAAQAWKRAVIQHNGLMMYFRDVQGNKYYIIKYIRKIKEYDPDYEEPEVAIPRRSCYIATAVYGSYDCPQVWTLRRYRDDTLAATWYGRAFIRTYYAVSPTLVRWFGETTWFRKLWKPRLDKMVERLRAKGVQDTPYQDKDQ